MDIKIILELKSSFDKYLTVFPKIPKGFFGTPCILYRVFKVNSLHVERLLIYLFKVKGLHSKGQEFTCKKVKVLSSQKFIGLFAYRSLLYLLNGVHNLPF